jgi:hypothetical protein
MSVTSFLESVGRILVSNSPSLVAIGLVSYWVKTRLRESIRHEYEKELEEFKFEMRKREQSALVADLFSTWVHVKEDNEEITESEEERYRKLNRLSFEMSLWLPDQLAIEINNMLQWKGKGWAELLIECRKVIQNTETTELQPGNITYFNTKSRKWKEEKAS